MMDYDTAEDIKRHFSVVAESLRSDIRLVIEGVAANTERLDRVEVRLDRMDTRFDRVEVRLGGVEAEVRGLRNELGALQTRIEPLISGS